MSSTLSGSTLAGVVVVAYVVAVTFVGLRGWSLASNSDMYNIFGRRAGTIRAASGFLSLIGGGELVTITQFGYDNGLSSLWFLGGVAAGFVGLALWGMRMHALAKGRAVNTLSGLFTDQFGSSAGAAITIVNAISLGSLLIIQFIVGSQLMSAISGIPPLIFMGAMGLVILAYMVPAGIVAVLSTDVLKVIMMTAALLTLAVTLLVQSDTDARNVRASFEPLGIIDGGTLFVLGFFGAVCAADVWQTIFAAADAKTARRSLMIGAAVFLAIGLLIAEIGMITKAVVPVLPEDVSAFIVAARDVVPHQLVPLFALMVVGTVMSTADTEIWVISTLLVANWWPRMARPTGASPVRPGDASISDKVRSFTKALLPVVTIVAVALAALSSNAQALYEGLLVLLTAISPVILAVLWGTKDRLGVTIALWSAVAGFLFLAIVYRFAIPVNLAMVPAAVCLATLVFVRLFRGKRGSV